MFSCLTASHFCVQFLWGIFCDGHPEVTVKRRMLDRGVLEKRTPERSFPVCTPCLMSRCSANLLGGKGIRYFRMLWRLSWQDRLLLLEALLFLAGARLVIVVLPFKRVAQFASRA